MIGNLGSKMITLFMLPFYTKFLSVIDYGVVDLIGVYAAFLIPIISFSLSEAIFIFPKSQNFKRQKEYFSSGLIFSLIIFLIAFFLFFIIRHVLEYNSISNVFTQYTWLIYLSIFASFIQSFIQQFSRSIDKLTVYVVTGVLSTLLIAILSFLLVPRIGIRGYVFAQILSLLLTAIYCFIHSKAYLFLSIRDFQTSCCSEMIRYSLPLIPNGVMWWIVGALNRPIMEKFIGLHSIGLFAVANKIPSIIALFFSVFFYSWQITVIEEFNKDGYTIFFNKIFRIIFSFLIFLSCILTISSEWIMSMFVDDKFIAAWKYVPFLSLAVVFSSISGLVGSNFSATRESKYYFYSSIWGAVISIVLNIALIPLLGIYGASISVIFGHFVMAFSRIVYSWKYVNIENVKYYCLMIVINLVIIATTLMISNFLIRMVAYSICLFLFVLLNRHLKYELVLFYKSLMKKL